MFCLDVRLKNIHVQLYYRANVMLIVANDNNNNLFLALLRLQLDYNLQVETGSLMLHSHTNMFN